MEVTPLSFEFFPPNTTDGIEKLETVATSLNLFRPDYFSVTFGAGGVNREKSFHTIRTLQKKNYDIAPHLTCIDLSKEMARDIILNYKKLSISKLVVIRGDLTPEMPQNIGDFHYANELVKFIRDETGNYFEIHVAAYPEFHPQSVEINTALLQFKNKIDAGANSAITQYFFNAEGYFQFLKSCEKLNIRVPIVPGIMPIFNFEKLIRFSKMCCADIPLWLYKRLESYRHDEASIKAYGIEVVTKLCSDLIANGCPALHFYTMNQLEPTKTILQNLGYADYQESRAFTESSLSLAG
ncbi:MAG TPA: methylenetetrahydrofolate reductase [NAD(P)H] [Coxiellaceae bacterium]|nr:MAG: methylenetetrahydrofolate reductase [NAD(P)H] [Gammaproteobacteria bacterium RIFCSPHIGHO2_12_FULL_36_30]HLB57178.1 methylenetetrahydrofolate reductase [NAD(P)H] [Coxiellaceae bacterium]